MLALKTHLLKNFSYCKGVASFPVVAELVTDTTIELATKLDIRELTLTRLDASSEDDFFGSIRRSGLGVPKFVFEIVAFRSQFFVYDVFELDEAKIAEYRSGEYRLRLVLDVFVKQEDKFNVSRLIAEEVVIVK